MIKNLIMLFIIMIDNTETIFKTFPRVFMSFTSGVQVCAWGVHMACIPLGHNSSLPRGLHFVNVQFPIVKNT